MVHLILSSSKGFVSSLLSLSLFLSLLFTHITGNQGLRYFPHLGYLGLTPIRVEGSQLPLLFSHPSKLN